MQEDSFQIIGRIKQVERSKFLEPFVVASPEAALAKGMTLALMRPASAIFSYRPKSEEALSKERHHYQIAAGQGSLFDEEQDALEPCPYEFRYDWVDQLGNAHSHSCGDWETDATFFRWCRAYGASSALDQMVKKFGEEIPGKGMVFAMGTHSKRPKQWLLVGVIRLDESGQISLF